MKLGQKVVCVDADPGEGMKNRLTLGATYIIRGIITSPCCGGIKVDVGISTDCDRRCGNCRTIYDPHGTAWFKVSRFRPLEEKSETMIETVLESIREKV